MIRDLRKNPFFKIKFSSDIPLSKVQFDLKQLFNDILSKKMSLRSIEGVGFNIPFELVNQASYPALYQWMNKKNLTHILNDSGFCFLWTDPNQFDLDTPTNKLDRYFPHLDVTSNEFTSGSLNIPVENCDSYTTTNWHKINPSEKKIIRLDTVHLIYEESKDTIFKSICMNMSSALLIRTDIFHSVRNLGKKKRVIAGWRVKPDFSWDKIYKYFSENNLIEHN